MTRHTLSAEAGNSPRRFRIDKEFLFEYKSVIALLVFMVVVSLISDSFFSADNLLNILRQTSINAIIAVGMTFVILTSGIDLSVGSVLALTGALAASNSRPTAERRANTTVKLSLPVASFSNRTSSFGDSPSLSTCHE